MSLFIFILFQVFAALLVYSCFCRASFTNKGNTLRPVRWTFSMLGVVACFALFGPWITTYEPDGFATALLGAITLTQMVTSHYWRAGVPQRFRKQ